MTVLPILLLVGSIGTSSKLTFRTVNANVLSPINTFPPEVVSNFFYPEDFRPENYIYLSITLALNILLTSLIIGRLSYCKHKIRQLMEEAEVNHYTFVSMMFIESAAPNVLCSIAMIISVAANTSYFQIAYAVSPAVQVWDDVMTRLIRKTDWEERFLSMCELFYYSSRIAGYSRELE